MVPIGLNGTQGTYRDRLRVLLNRRNAALDMFLAGNPAARKTYDSSYGPILQMVVAIGKTDDLEAIIKSHAARIRNKTTDSGNESKDEYNCIIARHDNVKKMGRLPAHAKRAALEPTTTEEENEPFFPRGIP